jgi:hypothetical protein
MGFTSYFMYKQILSANGDEDKQYDMIPISLIHCRLRPQSRASDLIAIRSYPKLLFPCSYNVVACPPDFQETMNFAPYQDQSPELERALSPPLTDGHRVISPNLRSPRASADLPSPSHFVGGGHGNTGFGRDVDGGHVSLGAFETSLPIRMDVEAMLAYLLLPPAGGVFLLLTEHKSDYVR